MRALSEAEGRALTFFARGTIVEVLGGEPASAPETPALLERGASFVTLRRSGTLHGCIGSIEARRRLVDDVAQNAVAAALYDPRATPLSRRDVLRLDVEVSVLTPLSRVPGVTEDEILAELRAGIDGVVFRGGGRSATFLPQMWERFTGGRELLGQLKRKAGLPTSFWSATTEVYRFQVERFEDAAPAAPAAAGQA